MCQHLHSTQRNCSFLLLLTCQVLLQPAHLSYMGVLFIFYDYSSYYHYCQPGFLAQGRELSRHVTCCRQFKNSYASHGNSLNLLCSWQQEHRGKPATTATWCPRDTRTAGIYSRRQRCQSVWCSVRNSASWLASPVFVWSTRRCNCTARGAQLALGQQPAEKKSILTPPRSSEGAMGKITLTASEVHMVLPSQTLKQTTGPHFYRKIASIHFLKWTIRLIAADYYEEH